jgi:tetratricopeptide (TPR) repeat protein
VEELLAAVRARLDAATATRDLSGVLAQSATAEALALSEALTGTRSGDQQATEARYLLGWLRWYRSMASAGELSARERDAATDSFLPLFVHPGWPLTQLPEELLPELVNRSVLIATADIPVAARVVLWRRIVQATGEDHPDFPGRLMSLSLALHERSGSAKDAADLTEAIRLVRRALVLIDADNVQRSMYLAGLVSMLTALFDRTGLPAALDEAVETGRLAAAAVTDDDPVRGAILAILGIALLKQAARTGSLGTIDELVRVSREALASAAGERGSRLSLLGSAIQARFERTGTLADLDEAISTHREAAACTPLHDPGRPGLLANLSLCLRLRFGRTSAVGALGEAVVTAHEAVSATTEDTPDRGTCLMSLGLALLARFERFGSPADLTEAVRLSRAAADITEETGSARATRLSNLSVCLQTLAKHTDTPDALAEAVSAGRRALELTPGTDISRPGRESNLAIALKDVFERTGALDALEEAIALGGSALRGIPQDHPARSFCLSNVASAHWLRFRHAGTLADLDAAIRLGREAASTAPADHPDRPIYLSNLGGTLQTRAERTGSTSDLEAAIRAHREAMDHTPEDHPDRARRLANLAVAQKAYAIRTASDNDLDAAVSAARAASDAMHRDHPDQAVALSNLGSALRERFKRSGSLDDIAASIQAHGEALAAPGAGRPGRGGYLSNYANALLARAMRVRSVSDLDKAISVLENAIGSPPGDGPDNAVYLRNLGNALRARAELTGSEDDRRAAITKYTAAVEAETAAPSVRVGAAGAMAELLTAPDPARHADVLATAVELLPRLAGRYLSRGDQQEALSGLSGLIADAAALTLMNGRLSQQRRAERALRLIEAGRTVIHTQALNTRSDISELRRRDAALAQRFTELRDLLDPASASEAALPQGNAHADPYELSQEFDALLARIRRLPGLASLAALPSLRELRRDAALGPVVTFNVSRHRSDALLLTRDGVQVVPLPRLAVGILGEQLTAFYRALADAAAPGYAARVQAEKRLGEVLAWLWEAAAAPVLAVLGRSQRPICGAWPRLWWAPGGLLGLLPIHAAGYHNGAGDAVLDRVVSSYTPTISALRYACQKASSAATLDRSAPGSARSLVVAMPTTPAAGGQPPPPPLPHANEEASAVAARLPHPVVLVSADNEDAAVPGQVTREAVFAHLPDCSIAHFACHGATDPGDPQLSRLLLQDHGIAPLTVASLASIRLDRSRLAYLSACRTAHQDGTELLDEAIHLASAFQLAGFPHVIATLWQVGDPAAVRVAEDFYACLTAGREGAVLDPDRAAIALHHAINALRNGSRYRARLSAWASYIHVGA